MDDSTDAIRAEIHRKAAARVEARLYSLENAYMTQEQKAKVESVYQFPSGVFDYSFALFALWQHLPIWPSFVGASVIASTAWLFARFLPGRLFWPLGIFFSGNVAMLICLLAAGYAMLVHLYGVAVFLVLAGYGATTFIEAPSWLWNLTSRGMNSKYGIAKRMYGITFPFETDLDR